MDYNDYDKMFLDEYDKMLYPEIEQKVTKSVADIVKESKADDAEAAIGRKFLKDVMSYNGHEVGVFTRPKTKVIEDAMSYDSYGREIKVTPTEAERKAERKAIEDAKIYADFEKANMTPAERKALEGALTYDGTPQKIMTPTERKAIEDKKYNNEARLRSYYGDATIKQIQTTVIEDALSYAGIKLEDMGKFLEKIGSVNVGGIDFTLKDLMPIGDNVISALKLAGSGMPMTDGFGIYTQLKPELNMAAAEIAASAALANPVGAGLKRVAKSIVKNKAKVATGAAAVVGTSSKQNERN